MNVQPITLQVQPGHRVTIMPDAEHEFLMTTAQVAEGYGTSIDAIRKSKKDHLDELIEGKHFLKGVTKSHGLSNVQPNQVYWTKRGIIRLGFFIKSERAKMFRDWAEDLIVSKLTKRGTVTPDLLSMVDRASQIAGSEQKLCKLIGVSASTISFLESRPDVISPQMAEKILAGCRKVIQVDGLALPEPLRDLLMGNDVQSIKDGLFDIAANKSLNTKGRALAKNLYNAMDGMSLLMASQQIPSHVN